MWQCLLHTYKKEGFLALYKGIIPNVIRSVPNSCILFFSYELIYRYLNKVRPENKLMEGL